MRKIKRLCCRCNSRGITGAVVSLSAAAATMIPPDATAQQALRSSSTLLLRDDSVADAISVEDVTSATNTNSLSQAPRLHDSSDTMEVTITVLSVQGVLASPIPNQRSKKKNHHSTTSNTTTTTTTFLVASFCHTFSSVESRLSSTITTTSTDDDKTLLTHVPSIPMPMETLDASLIPSNPTPQPIVYWPSMDDSDDDRGDRNQALSTLRFSRRFEREDVMASQVRFMPQMCPINISIARNGKMIGLGKAKVFISGEEKGFPSVIVPVKSSCKAVNGRKSLMKKVTGIVKGRKSLMKKVTGIIKGRKRLIKKERRKSSVTMVKIKGDNLMFGLKNDATIRVLVSVTNVKADVRNEEENVAETQSDGVLDLSYKGRCYERNERNHIEQDDDISVTMEDTVDDSLLCDDDTIESESGKPITSIERFDDSFTHIGDIDQSEVITMSVNAVECNLTDIVAFDEAATTLNCAAGEFTVSATKDVSAVLLWCAMAAILGSPVPSFVTKNGRKRERGRSAFWDDLGEDDIPDLHDEQDASAVNSAVNRKVHTDLSAKERADLKAASKNTSIMEKTTSSSSEDESEDVSASKEEAGDMESLANVLEIDLDNDEIDPIKALDEPCTNHKTSSSRESLCAAKPHLLDEAPVEMNEHDVRLFPAHEDERVNLDDEIINDIPSLSESKESVERSPQLKKRQYKFIESIVDNDMMAQIEAMANRVDQCPYCELLCCQEFPCAMRSIKERCQS